MKTAILISGRGSNLRAILETEQKGNLGNAKILVVISDKSNAAGLNHAIEFGKETLVIEAQKNQTRAEYDKEIEKVLKTMGIELVVLAGFMRILSKDFVEKFKNKIINIHPSLLPSFPGLKAQKQALDYGAKISGCTVHFVNEEVDAGPIILQKEIIILDNDTEDSLSKRILSLEHELLPLAIRLISLNRVSVNGRQVKVV